MTPLLTRLRAWFRLRPMGTPTEFELHNLAPIEPGRHPVVIASWSLKDGRRVGYLKLKEPKG